MTIIKGNKNARVTNLEALVRVQQVTITKLNDRIDTIEAHQNYRYREVTSQIAATNGALGRANRRISAMYDLVVGLRAKERDTHVTNVVNEAPCTVVNLERTG